MSQRQPFHYNDSTMTIDDTIDPPIRPSQSAQTPRDTTSTNNDATLWNKITGILKKYSRFIGPGLMVSVAYMDPGNYSTAVAAGSAYKYKLLFSILLSNCLAIFLQILSAKLGAVTGLDLAANCRANLPFKYNIIMYVLAEIAIIATDLAEVVGTAIALNILFKIPLLLGVIVTVIDVLIVLMAYRPNGPLLFIRIFEGFVSVLVALTVVCFTVELYQVSHDPSVNFSVIEVFKGFLPNEKVVDMSDREGGNGLFLSLAILGATVMPHSLYLGSGVVQARLKDFDVKNGFYNPLSKNQNSILDELEVEQATEQQQEEEDIMLPRELVDSTGPQKQTTEVQEETDEDDEQYRPSIHAINDTMVYTMVELVISLFTVALFVNSAILIVAGATLTNQKREDHDESDEDSDSDDETYQNADLFTIYNLLSSHISPTAGFVFALALLFSGQSAGVVCTLAGQMVSEGFLSWSFPPVTRRLITRGLAILPCLVVVSMTGRAGLANVLNASQVVLSVLLPVVSAPLIWFTCSKSIMRVPLFVRDGDEDADLVYETDDDNSIYLVSSSPSTIVASGPSARGPVKFKSTEPAIRLQDLRNSHPCSGWDDEEEHDEEQQRLIGAANSHAVGNSSRPHVKHYSPDAADSTPKNPLLSSGDDGSITSNSARTFATDALDNSYRVKGYKDMSNGPIVTFLAVLVWSFITGLNLFLIGSMLLGKEVPL
ncbi:manganese transporter Smf1p [[Candida] anglica]|uniref:Manganese transporter Smf1p n=1 Tax=[Candida] anglica TaxID=148631 RepID=A0ABP0E8X4_9ASCO